MSRGVIIITGAGGGIGRATAVELSRRDYHCVLVGRTQSTLLETQRLAGASQIIVADVTQAGAVEQVVADTVSRFGRIDGIVNNAGLAPNLPIDQCTPQQWREVIDVNLSAAFYLCHAVWPIFAKQGGGVIVNISSMAARDPFPGFVAYGAAKAGLNNLGITLSRQGRDIGIRVHTIAPGAVETPMFRQLMTPQQWPTDQTLQPLDVAAVVVQCITGELRHTSGEVIWLSRRP